MSSAERLFKSLLTVTGGKCPSLPTDRVHVDITHGHIRKLIVFVRIVVTERIKGKIKSMKTLTIAKQLLDFLTMSTAWLNCLSACRTGRQEHSLSLGSIRSSHRLGEISSDLGKNSRRLGLDTNAVGQQLLKKPR